MPDMPELPPTNMVWPSGPEPPAHRATEELRCGPATVTPEVAPTYPPEELPALPGYEILENIGHGGMGAVFRVRDLRLKRELAIKVLLDKHRSNPLIRQRFLAE